MDFGISFDFWNTLFADGDEPLRREKRKQLLLKTAQKYRPAVYEEIDRAFAVATDFFITEWRNRHRTPTTIERLELIFTVLEIEISPSDINELAEKFGAMVFEIRPGSIEGVAQVLEKLSVSYPLGIISDTGYVNGKFLRGFLEQEGCLQYFRSLIFSDEVGVSKPQLQVFEQTAETLGVPIGQLVHIGDLEPTDITGANQAGAVSVLFSGANNRYANETRAQYVFDNYDRLPDILAEIVSEQKVRA